ncbi:MAG: biotin carboxylase N-terminal domain-containing protein, partial [Nitrospinota bacterium]
MFKKILIANRGEIAVRVIRTCREMGIRTVAVYSDVDADSLHVRLADEAFPLGAPEATHSYLNSEKILEIAERSDAEAIHPGYGFLAENPEFVEACEGRGIVFIGPPSRSMRKAKPKHEARNLVRTIGVPVTPGSENAIEIHKDEITNISKIAEEIGYPLIVKPIGAGGGIGMRVVRDREELLTAAKYAQNRGLEAFGIPAFYLEKYLPRVRHIEFQVLADKKENVVHL